MSSRAFRPIVVGAGLLGIAALAGCSAAEVENRSYADGIYSALGGYSSPGGPQSISVALQLKNDEIAWVMVTPSSFIGEAGEFQSRFAEEIQGEVVGVDIDRIAISRVAGSSLTSTAFNDALGQIKVEAVEP
jgi:hypothetical protein